MFRWLKVENTAQTLIREDLLEQMRTVSFHGTESAEEQHSLTGLGVVGDKVGYLHGVPGQLGDSQFLIQVIRVAQQLQKGTLVGGATFK